MASGLRPLVGGRMAGAAPATTSREAAPSGESAPTSREAAAPAPRGDRIRRACFEGGTYSVAATSAYALLLVLLRASGGARLGGAACCLLLLAAAALAARWPQRAVAALRRRPGIVPAVGMALALAFAALGGDGRQLFLPALLLLATLGVVAGARRTLAAALLAAAGLLAPLLADFDAVEQRRLLLLSAAAVALVPPLLALLAGRAASSGESPTTAVENSPVLAAPASTAARERSHAPLTPRQRDAVALAAAGLRQAEIAERMGVSIHQVRRLLQQGRERVHARTTRELVAWAMMQGIVAPPQGTETEARPSND
ncbi:MAG TPA: helix-turn-helix transcriptional regulator [Conexibacter sp.]|nr:helix-turn-helix transcriptional regulator [Conexibacter sp.]